MNLLLDTNILVYHVAGDPTATSFVEESITNSSFRLSILSVVEFLGWQGHSDEKFMMCKELFGLATIFTVSGNIADTAIELRRRKRIKLADAIIASTALVKGLGLATRNIRDFKGIRGLQLVNPFE